MRLIEESDVVNENIVESFRQTPGKILRVLSSGIKNQPAPPLLGVDGDQERASTKKAAAEKAAIEKAAAEKAAAEKAAAEKAKEQKDAEEKVEVGNDPLPIKKRKILTGFTILSKMIM